MSDGKPSRASKRREERAHEQSITGSLKLHGGEVVVAVAVNGPRDAHGMRPYQTWVRGPATQHTNAEMLQLLAMLATTITLGNAFHSKVSVQQAIDGTIEVFSKALSAHVHQQIASGKAQQGMTTVDMKREEPKAK